MKSAIIVVSIFFCFGCASLRYTYFSGEPNFANFTQEEKDYYEENNQYFNRYQWADWLFEPDQQKRVEWRKINDPIIAEYKIEHENRQKKIEAKEKEQEYLGCTRVNTDELSPAIYLTASETEECIGSEVIYSNKTIGFPRIVYAKSNKNSVYQIYVYYEGSSWVFYDSYSFKFKDKLITGYVKKIDSEVKPDSGTRVREDFLINITEKQFKDFAKEGLTLRIAGKRGNSTISIPMKSFADLNKILNERVLAKRAQEKL